MLFALNGCMYGANLMKKKVACPAFADDVTILAVSKEGIQQLVSMAYNYSRKWRFSFNPSKCKLIVFGKDGNKKIEVKIGNHVIKQVTSDKHLGTLLSSKEKCTEDFITQRIQASKSVCHATQSLGTYRVPVTPVTSNKLYWQVAIPKLCYGLQVMTLTDASLENIEQLHSSTAKYSQGLPNQCSNPGSNYHCCVKRNTWTHHRRHNQ